MLVQRNVRQGATCWPPYRRMSALQIDTIHVVARSPYLVLWSRLGAYEPRWLDELLAEGAIFEYWSHEACFLPVEDYPALSSQDDSARQDGLEILAGMDQGASAGG